MAGVNWIIIFIGIISCVVAFEHHCRKNSHFSQCTDSCAPTCRNPFPTTSECEIDCEGGCVCDRGYVKNHRGDCVPWRKCRRHRRYRKKYRSHSSSTGSTESTASSDYSADCGSDKSRDCYSSSTESRDSSTESSDRSTRSSDYSTESRDSYSKSRSHERKCGPNEKYARCKRKCPETCKKKRPSKCDNKCYRKGCVCKYGFVKDEYDNCIPRGLCEPKKDCDKNEKYVNETVHNPTCQTPSCRDNLPKYCPLYSTPGGCVCKAGFVRDKKGNCVAPQHCESSSTEHKSSRKSSNKSSRRRRKYRRGSCESYDCSSETYESDGSYSREYRYCCDFSDSYDRSYRRHYRNRSRKRSSSDSHRRG